MTEDSSLMVADASASGIIPRGGVDWLEFDIHGVLRMWVDAAAPTADQMKTMFAPFLRTGRSETRPDLVVEGAPRHLIEPSHAEHAYRYDDRCVSIAGLRVQVEIDANGRFAVRGPGELLTAVVPLLDWVLGTRDVAMVHAAAVSHKGRGIAMPAWGGVGKTSTIAKLARIPNTAFMGDDWTFMSAAGQMLGYAKPMFIKTHHRPIYPHLFTGARKPLVPSRLTNVVSKVTTLAHPTVVRYPRLAALTRRWSPEHRIVTPQQALPTMEHAASAPLSVAVFVERHAGDRDALLETTRSWMVSRMIGNFHAELPQPSRDIITALASTGLAPMEELYGRKSEVLHHALADTPTYLLKVPAAWPADRASDVIVERLMELSSS